MPAPQLLPRCLTAFRQIFETELSHSTAAVDAFSSLSLYLRSGAVQKELISLEAAPFQKLWQDLRLSPPADEFDWDLVAKLYLREVRRIAREQGAEAERQQDLFSIVFVPPFARESPVAIGLFGEGLLHLNAAGLVTGDVTDDQLDRLTHSSQEYAPRPVMELLQSNRYPALVLTAEAGEGKSALLRYVARRWPETHDNSLALLAPLHGYPPAGGDFLDFLLDSSVDAPAVERAFVEIHLRTGNSIVLLDGLDSLQDASSRRRLSEEVRAFQSAYPKSQIVITTRPAGYDPGPLTQAGFAHFCVQPFDHWQIGHFLHHWHELAIPDAKLRAQLIGRMRESLEQNRGLRELAANPFQLTLCAILNQRQTLPLHRPTLYGEALQVLIEQWNISRALGIATTSPGAAAMPASLGSIITSFMTGIAQELLRRIAFFIQGAPRGLQANRIPEAKLEELAIQLLVEHRMEEPEHRARLLLSHLAEPGSLLQQVGGHFGFRHRLFLDYFCAEAIARELTVHHACDIERICARYFAAHWWEESWRDVLPLITGMLSEAYAAPIIECLLGQEGRFDLLHNVGTAARCLEAVHHRSVLAQSEQDIRKALEEALSFDLESPPENALVRTEAVRSIARLWQGERHTVNWLRELIHSANCDEVRRTALGELVGVTRHEPHTVDWLKDLAYEDANATLRRGAVEELANLAQSDPQTYTWLLTTVQSDANPAARRAALVELARTWRHGADVLPLLQTHAQSDINRMIRRTALEELILSFPDDPETLPIVRERALTDNSPEVRRTAITALTFTWKEDEETLPVVLSLATNRSPEVRRAAMLALAREWKNHPQTLAIVRAMAESEDEPPASRRAALEELARAWKDLPETYTTLRLRAKTDKSPIVRIAALAALTQGFKHEREVLALLRSRFDADHTPSVRYAAVIQLARAWKDHPETPTVLCAIAQNNEDPHLSIAALTELARRFANAAQTKVVLHKVAQSAQYEGVRVAAAFECERLAYRRRP